MSSNAISKAGVKCLIHFLEKDSSLIHAAAQTVALSFSNDPLITWLRPGAAPWGDLRPESLQWQYRRLAWARIEGTVIRAEVPCTPASSAIDMSLQTNNSAERCAGIGLIYPPKTVKKWGLGRTVEWLWLKLADLFCARDDEGGSMERVEILMNSHEAMLSKLKKRYSKDLWYIEICAVHPTAQGMGVGKVLMEWILAQANGAPCFLECTNEENVAFYQKYGFETVEEVVLTEGKESVKLFCMVRHEQKGVTIISVAA